MQKRKLLITLALALLLSTGVFGMRAVLHHAASPATSAQSEGTDSPDTPKSTQGSAPTADKVEVDKSDGSKTAQADSSDSLIKSVLKAVSSTITPVRSSGSAPTQTTPPSTPGISYKSKPAFAFYYLWWSMNNWTSHLGPSYPYAQTPNPLPATLDASGCSTVNNYQGNVLTDVSQNLWYVQDDYNVIYSDVKAAAQSGLTGFAVNWAGTGEAGQKTSDLSYSRRLADVFRAVHQINSEGYPFKIMLNYKASASILTMMQFKNDFDYLKALYKGDSALDHTYSDRMEVIIAGSWKYSDADVAFMGSSFRSDFYLIGDEKPSTWNQNRAASLDGASYYWSSQNPYSNPASFTQLKNFAATIRTSTNPDGSKKLWLAPFAPGYNSQILYGSPTCVPRNGTETMHKLYAGNLPTSPDGWTLISWNEISEGTYIVPLTRYGNTYVNELHTILVNGG